MQILADEIAAGLIRHIPLLAVTSMLFSMHSCCPLGYRLMNPSTETNV
jgi:hypothetical protein